MSKAIHIASRIFFFNSFAHFEDTEECLAVREYMLDGRQFSFTVSSEEGKVNFLTADPSSYLDHDLYVFFLSQIVLWQPKSV